MSNTNTLRITEIYEELDSVRDRISFLWSQPETDEVNGELSELRSKQDRLYYELSELEE